MQSFSLKLRVIKYTNTYRVSTINVVKHPILSTCIKLTDTLNSIAIQTNGTCDVINAIGLNGGNQ